MTKHATPFRGNLSNADIARLREFVEIVSAGGITAAQARLGKGKSAISLGLTRLEERLGLHLCERGRGGFRLTQQGLLVHSAAVQLLAEIGRFTDFVGATTRKLEDEITLYADDSFVFEFGDPLARAIARINDHYPDVKLNIRMSSPDHIYESVLEGSADIGFTALIRDNPALNATPISTELMGIFCGRDHPLFRADDTKLSYDDLRQHGFVASEVMQEEGFSEFFRGLTIKAIAPTILSRMIMILSSRYLGVVPVEFARHWVEKGAIRELQIDRGRTENTCFLIHRKARPLGLGGAIFREMIAKELQAG
ncbi:LysR family transcriptional regulator [Falsochrobactrum shanghaiense]|uniref:LysR family transcriptional regulator n=1 Tax=Falsochrobactrum shanghaiense TaxID=2201899 RepID=UPI001304A0F4|nr:LysR family transcriptional regulator [Falsochrobactrum shanghaiense]